MKKKMKINKGLVVGVEKKHREEKTQREKKKMEWFWNQIIGTARVTRDKTWHKLTKAQWGNNTKPIRMAPDHSFWKELESFLDHTPTLVVPGLYLGNACHAANWNLLQTLGISSILNVTDEISNYFEGNSEIQYKRIPILDDSQADISEFLEPAYHFLAEKIQAFQENKKSGKGEAGGATLVHCFMGSSRSASIVIYYLMRSSGLTMDQALNQVKTLRPIVNLNTRFLAPLVQQNRAKR